MQRRDFLKAGGSCLAHVSLWGLVAPPDLRERFAARPFGVPVRVEPWGRIEKITDGVWVLISTPLVQAPDNRRTFSNGGIVAGRQGVAVVEGFATDLGAKWMAELARELTGRAPTHVILTHYHGDHSNGLAGYRADGHVPLFVTTEATRTRVSTAPAAALTAAQLVGEHTETIDLGGVKLVITPRAGHTPSDLSVAVEDPRVVFGGDLLWNGMFPNYRDAVPSVLSRAVRELLRDDAVRIPGHGAIPTPDEARNYVALLDLVEDAARRAIAGGKPIEIAANEFVVPASLGEWGRFSEAYYRVAMQAWERELRPS